jgi:GMP synthase (glutamine-hydrolysing)
MHPASIAILDFGSQYVQLIARRVRENHVYSVIVGPEVTAAELRDHNAAGLIFSGGPGSVYVEGAPRCRSEVLELGLPILGICYGMHLACEMMGGDVGATTSREYGRTPLTVVDHDVLLSHVP